MANISKIQKILNKLGPLSSQQVVERFIRMLSERGVHTLSEKEFDRILMFAPNDCYGFLKERLTMYLQHGIAHRNHIEKKQSGKQSSSSPRSFYSDNRSTSLKEQGYEYGLSDW